MVYTPNDWTVGDPITEALLDHLETQYQEMLNLFGANSILMAIADNDPAALTIAASRILGRKSSGNIGALTGAEIMAILSGKAAASFSMNSKKITSLLDPTANQDADTKVARVNAISTHAGVATAHQDAPGLITTHTAIATAHQNAPGLISTHAALATAHQDAPALIAVHGNGHIVLFLHNYNSIGQGTWVMGGAGDKWAQNVFENSSAGNGDNISCKVYLAQGTYTLRMIFQKSTVCPVVDIDVDGTEEGSVDTYTASPSDNNIYTITGITVATAKILDIRIRADGKHGSSSAYRMLIQGIALWRTA